MTRVNLISPRAFWTTSAVYWLRVAQERTYRPAFGNYLQARACAIDPHLWDGAAILPDGAVLWTAPGEPEA